MSGCRLLLDAQAREIASTGGGFVSTVDRIVSGTRDAKDAMVKQQRQDREKTLVKQSKGTIMVELRELWRGSFFGEMSIMLKHPRSASVVAGSCCELLVMSKIDFFRVFDKRGLHR